MFFSVQVKNDCLMSFLVACLCHPFFSLTFMLIWYLKVIGNTLARLVNGMSWIVLKFFKQKAAGCMELKGLFTSFQVSSEDRSTLWALITFYGGNCQLSLNNKCTHLIVPEPKGVRVYYMYNSSCCSSHLLLNNQKFSISLKLGFLRLFVSLEQLNSTQLRSYSVHIYFLHGFQSD